MRIHKKSPEIDRRGRLTLWGRHGLGSFHMFNSSLLRPARERVKLVRSLACVDAAIEAIDKAQNRSFDHLEILVLSISTYMYAHTI